MDFHILLMNDGSAFFWRSKVEYFIGREYFVFDLKIF